MCTVDSRTGGQVDKVESYRKDRWINGQTGRKTSDCKVANFGWANLLDLDTVDSLLANVIVNFIGVG